MKKSLFTLLACLTLASAWAQKPRPDAFPPVDDSLAPKSLSMATTLAEMYRWDRYPTYDVYLDMMRHFVETYPDLCRVDTIGKSVRGRLILCLAITGTAETDIYRPEFFYSSTMHGDEITGFYFMLRLCDTLLSSYGTSPQITALLDRTRVYINPNANPDGTYAGGDNSVSRSIRYNANYVDLNRNYPDPFGTDPLDTLQPENRAMIDYVSQHRFEVSANLHGGSEVMNYPWDSFTSRERPVENADWWKAVCKRFVDTCRQRSRSIFTDVNSQGYIAGGDWYVISNGRQDYMNYYHNMREMTMEVSSEKKLPSENLQRYWNIQGDALINYIKEVLPAGDTIPPDTTSGDTTHVGIENSQLSTLNSQLSIFPNPTRGEVFISTGDGIRRIDLSDRPAGIYILNVKGRPYKVIKL